MPTRGNLAPLRRETGDNRIELDAVSFFFVIAGLGPATHEFFYVETANTFVDTRAEPAQDGVKWPHVTAPRGRGEVTYQRRF
jgi:hypothetical protein